MISKLHTEYVRTSLECSGEGNKLEKDILKGDTGVIQVLSGHPRFGTPMGNSSKKQKQGKTKQTKTKNTSIREST